MFFFSNHLFFKVRRETIRLICDWLFNLWSGKECSDVYFIFGHKTLMGSSMLKNCRHNTKNRLVKLVCGIIDKIRTRTDKNKKF